MKAIFASLFRSQPQTAEDNYNRGCEHYKAGHYERAIHRFDLALGMPNDDIRVMFIINEKGKSLLKLNRPNEALACFEQVITCRPKNITAHNGKGECLLQLGYYENAINSFRTVIATKTNDIDACKGIGFALFKLGRYEEAKTVLESTIQIFSKHSPQTELRKQLTDVETRTIIEQKKTTEKDKTEILNTLGQIYCRLGDMSNAQSAFTTVLNMDPQNADALRSIKLLVLSTPQPFPIASSAERTQFQSHETPITDNTPPSLATLYEEADSLTKQKNFDAALAAYTHILSYDKENPHVYNCIGDICLKTHVFAGALNNYKKALKRDPNNRKANEGINTALQAWCAEADSFSKKNHFEQALLTYNAIVHYDSAYIKILENIGIYSKVVKTYNAATDHNPEENNDRTFETLFRNIQQAISPPTKDREMDDISHIQIQTFEVTSTMHAGTVESPHQVFR